MAASTIPRFRELPMELQDQIWGHAIDNVVRVEWENLMYFSQEYEGPGYRLESELFQHFGPLAECFSLATSQKSLRLTNPELQDLLRKRHLRVSGKKMVLITRLYEQDQEQRRMGRVIRNPGYTCLFPCEKVVWIAPRSGKVISFGHE